MNSNEIARKCHCCACGGRIGRLNLVELDRAASWEYPTAGNVLTGESGKAVAVVCDGCIDSKAAPREAVEFRGLEVVYHPITELPPWRPEQRRIRWFRSSPDEGPDCECSWCSQPIEELDDDIASREWPAIRMWNDRSDEARFHPRCLDEAIAAGQITLR